MLNHLKIRNLALLESLDLELEAGLTAVTGETGAGKSVLLGALSLLSGARTDKTMIRQGSEALEVEAALYFEDPTGIDAVLEALGLPVCDEGVLLLRRTVHRTKMPRIQVNGGLATLGQLQELGESWIDFHGPGEPQKLFQERRQLEMLDAFAGNAEGLRSYRQDFELWRERVRELEAIEAGDRLDADEIAFLESQIRKIDAVGVDHESIEALERDFSRISSARDLADLAGECATGLSGEGGVESGLSRVVGHLEALVELDAASQPLLERARSLLIECEDLAGEFTRMGDTFDFDPETIESVTDRMNLWQDVRRKYGGTVDAVLEKKAELVEKLEMQGNLDSVVATKRKAAEALEAKLVEAAADLTEKRKVAAKTLADKSGDLLKVLGFKKAGLMIEVVPETTLRDYGTSRCRFLFAPNAGQELKPLNKIASSGETARVMLALKTVLAEADATPLLVFDEVDANVGGEVGRSVGAELSRLSGRHQVFCVTHLPQVASLAASHFVVRKLQDEADTRVEIESIHENADERLAEIARMLGDSKSSSARAHAEALLSGQLG